MPVTIVGWIGILIGLGAIFAVGRRERGVSRLTLVLALAVVQVAVAVYFYIWAQTNSTDANTYYNDPYGFFEGGFGLGTQFVIWAVQTIKGFAGGTYLDFFLLFQAAGTWGAVVIMKTFEEVFSDAGATVPPIFYWLLFLPGLHFWTAFIGKDGFLFLGVALTARAAVKIRTRWLMFGVGVLFMLLFRPYIAILAVSSIAVAVVLDGRTTPLAKIMLSFLALVGLMVAAGSVRSTFQVDITSADSVSDFMTTQSRVMAVEAQESGSGVSGSYPVRLVSLLFRPFFFDAGGIPGLIASFENLILLVIIGFLVWNLRTVRELFRRIMLIRYCVMFTITAIALLALVYYNVGLGLRQKVMIMPTLLILLAGTALSVRLRTRAPRARTQPA